MSRQLSHVLAGLKTLQEAEATLATQKGTSDVKDLAQKLVDDHTELNKELAAVADALSVMLPKKMTKEDQAEYEKLK